MKWHCGLLGWLYGERTCTDELGRIVGKITRSWRGGYEIEAYASGGTWEFHYRYVNIRTAKLGMARLLEKVREPKK